jgi:hypothetical protein
MLMANANIPITITLITSIKEKYPDIALHGSMSTVSVCFSGPEAALNQLAGMTIGPAAEFVFRIRPNKGTPLPK